MKNRMVGDILASMLENMKTILNAGIRTILFNGQKDFICNNDGVENAIANIDWINSKEFNAEPKRDYYVKESSGHLIVEDDKETSFDIVMRLIS